MKKALLVALALAIASLALAACGGSDDSSDTSAETQGQSGGAAEAGGESTGGEAEGGTAGSAAVVDFEAVEGSDLAYTTKSAEAEAGKDTVNFTNPQAIPHDVTIEDEGGKTIGATDVISEDSASTTVDLEPGSYTFFCSVPGHREAGMEGTLTVK